MNQQFCARPGCGLAKSAHGFLPAACGNFIAAKPKRRAALKAVRP